MKVRYATMADQIGVVRLMKDFASEIDIGKNPYPGDAKALGIYEQFIEAGHPILVCESDAGVLAGLIMSVHCSAEPMSPHLSVLAEMAWYVAPEFRGTSAGYRLIKEFIKLGKELGVDVVKVSLEEKSNVSENTMRKLGLRPLERTYILEK